MYLRSVSIFKLRRKPSTYKTLVIFSEAMEAKHVVATTEENGTVRLATTDKSVTLQSPTLAALYAPQEGSNTEAQSSQPETEGMVGNAAPSLLATEPWRGRALAAAEALVTQFDERSDINMEDCPIYDELKNIQMNVATEEGIDAERVSDILHAGQMFLYICDTDF